MKYVVIGVVLVSCQGCSLPWFGDLRTASSPDKRGCFLFAANQFIAYFESRLSRTKRLSLSALTRPRLQRGLIHFAPDWHAAATFCGSARRARGLTSKLPGGN